MDSSRFQQADTVYVDTPYGIFTAEGVWFHIREEALREYADAVLDEVPIERLLQWAALWMRSPQVIVLWLLPVALWFVPPLAAALFAVGFFAGWKVLSPSIVTEWGVRVVDVLDTVVVQGLYYVFVMSILAAQEQYAAVTVGLLGFVLLRWGLVDRALTPLLRPLLQALYTLPLADQVLRAFVVRTALNRRRSLSHLDAMEQDILDTWNYRKDQS